MFYPVDLDWVPRQTPVYLELFHPAEEAALARLAELGIDQNTVRSLQTDVFDGAPVGGGIAPMPVVVFSPGMGVDRDMALYLIRPLVERGYFVVTVGAPYDTVFTVFPDGDVVGQAPVIDSVGNTDWDLLLECCDVRVRDMEYVLAEVLRLNREDQILAGRLDTGSVAVLGHSLGGAAALEVAARNPGVKAVVSLDGAQVGAVRRTLAAGLPRVGQPAMVFRSQYTTADEHRQRMLDLMHNDPEQIAANFENGMDGLEQMVRELHRAFKDMYERVLTGQKLYLKLDGADHNTFTDLPALIPGLAAKLGLERAHQVIADLTCAFLDRHLRGIGPDVGSRIKAGEFPEVKLLTSDGTVVGNL
jgi:predicted dienelactone hydrolase